MDDFQNAGSLRSACLSLRVAVLTKLCARIGINTSEEQIGVLASKLDDRRVLERVENNSYWKNRFFEFLFRGRT